MPFWSAGFAQSRRDFVFFFCVCGIFNGMGRFLIRRYSVGIGRNLLRGVSTSQTLHVPDRNVDGRTVPKCASIRTLSIALCDDFAPLLYLLISIRNRKLIYTYRQWIIIIFGGATVAFLSVIIWRQILFFVYGICSFYFFVAQFFFLI